MPQYRCTDTGSWWRLELTPVIGSLRWDLISWHDLVSTTQPTSATNSAILNTFGPSAPFFATLISINPMKKLVLSSRILLGLTFTVFGLNGFLNFIKMPPPAGLGGQYMGVMFASHYLAVVFALEAVAGVLLLVNRFAPLALTILAPILANILIYHLLMEPQGAPVAVISMALWAVLFYRERASFSALFSAKGVV